MDRAWQDRGRVCPYESCSWAQKWAWESLEPKAPQGKTTKTAAMTVVSHTPPRAGLQKSVMWFVACQARVSTHSTLSERAGCGVKDDTAVTCWFTAQPEAGRGQPPHLCNKTVMQPGLGTRGAPTVSDLKGRRTRRNHHRRVAGRANMTPEAPAAPEREEGSTWFSRGQRCSQRRQPLSWSWKDGHDSADGEVKALHAGDSISKHVQAESARKQSARKQVTSWSWS